LAATDKNSRMWVPFTDRLWLGDRQGRPRRRRAMSTTWPYVCATYPSAEWPSDRGTPGRNPSSAMHSTLWPFRGSSPCSAKAGPAMWPSRRCRPAGPCGIWPRTPGIAGALARPSPYGGGIQAGRLAMSPSPAPCPVPNGCKHDPVRMPASPAIGAADAHRSDASELALASGRQLQREARCVHASVNWARNSTN